MKKIIIVNNNLQIGGVQKSLCDLLWAIRDRYDITLCLFDANGDYLQQLPPDIHLVQPKGPFRYLGNSQSSWKGIHALIRGGYALLAKVFGRNWAIKWMLAGEKELPEHYDCAISFLHNGKIKNFYGGTQEYVLRKIDADQKVAFLHCDYRNCGANHPVNNRLLAEFDRIACCSDGCRQAFLEVLPDMHDRTVTVRTAHRFDKILSLAEQEPATYPADCCNVVMVSRLAREKGIERALEAVTYCYSQGIAVMLHIVGGGNIQAELEETAAQLGIAPQVRFYGEQTNPYRFMRNADLLLMTSYHEAAPMVLDEALCLGIPALTTKTTSAEEMVTERHCGWVCDNAQSSINDMLRDVLQHKDDLRQLKETLRGQPMDNAWMIEQFAKLIEG